MRSPSLNPLGRFPSRRMPARTVKIRHDEETRARIQAAKLIDRLHGHVMGDVDLTAAQVQSARVLLNKSLPDLSNVTLSGDPDNPLQIQRVERTIVDPKNPDSPDISATPSAV